MRNSSAIFLILLLSFPAISIFKSSAASWPVRAEDRAGIMSTYGDHRTFDIGGGFHSGIDITQSAPNNNQDDVKTPVYPVRTGTVFEIGPYGRYGIVIETIVGGTWPFYDYEYDLYEHIELPEHANFEVRKTKVYEGTTVLGYIGEEGDPHYGNSSAHLHYAVCYPKEKDDEHEYKDYYPIKHPLKVLPGWVDTDAPVFRNIDVCGHPIDVVPNIVAGPPHQRMDGYVDKNRCPWRVWGNVDIITHVDDYMGVVGHFDYHDVDIVPGIYELKYEIYDGTQRILERYVLKSGVHDISLDGIPPGGKIKNDRSTRSGALRPSTFSQVYPGYEAPSLNYNHYVVTNVIENGGDWEINKAGCWNTNILDPGIYTIRVTAWDYPDSDGTANSSSTEIEVEVMHADYFVDINKIGQSSQAGTAENPYSTIQQAQGPDRTIYVAPGWYEGPVTMYEGMKLYGAGMEGVYIFGTGEPDSSVVIAEDLHSGEAVIDGFTIMNAGEGEYTGGLYCRNSDALSISNCRFMGNNNAGIMVKGDLEGFDPEIVNNIITDNYGWGIYLYFFASAHIEGNTIYQNDGGVQCFFRSSPVIIHNIIYSNGGLDINAWGGSYPSYPDVRYNDFTYYSGFIPGPGNFSADPRFVSGPISDFYLSQTAAGQPPPDSPCVDAGNIMAYWGTTRTDQVSDDGILDIGYHHAGLCITPTPPPTPFRPPTPTCTPTGQPFTGYVHFTGEQYVTTSARADIELLDWQLNTDPYTVQTVDVTVTSDTDPTGISFTLAERSTNSCWFDAYSNDLLLGFTTGPSIDYDSIQVSDGDTVTVTYHDVSPPVDVHGECVWYEVEIPSPTPTPTPTGTYFTHTPTPTRTPTPTPTGTWSSPTPWPTFTPTWTPGGPTFTPTPTPTPTFTPGPWTDTDSWGYTGTTITTYSWIDASVGTDLGITDDNQYISTPLNFSFPFYGENYDEVVVSANGYLTFGDDGSYRENDYVPNAHEPNAFIAPFFDDLRPRPCTRVYKFEQSGMVTFEWDLIRNERCWDDSYTFEVTLYDDGRIKFQYYVMSGLFADGVSATVGIENRTGTIGLRYRGTFNAGIIMDEMAIEFTPPSQTPTPTATPEVVHENLVTGFESGLGDWTATGLWHVVTTGEGNPYAKAHAGSCSVWYGQDSTGDYDTGTANWGELISPPIYLADNITFTFWSWEEVEPKAYFGVADNRLVYLSNDNGATWNLVFYHEPDTAGWEQHVVDIHGWKYQTVRVKFVFCTYNDELNEFPGWYVDDIEIHSEVPPPIPAISYWGLCILVLAVSFILFRFGITVRKRRI